MPNDLVIDRLDRMGGGVQATSCLTQKPPFLPAFEALSTRCKVRKARVSESREPEISYHSPRGRMNVSYRRVLCSNKYLIGEQIIQKNGSERVIALQP